jgi:hypothetical protein
VGQNKGRLHLSQQETVQPVGETKGDGGVSSALGAVLLLAIAVLIAIATLLPARSGIDPDGDQPASQFGSTSKNDCSSSRGFGSTWNCGPRPTSTGH